MINYDIHWNPVRLMQRIGRVDRRMNPEVEARLMADHPETSPATAGTVVFWNFLPPDELNAILSLYTRVTQKTLLISKTLGIEGKKLLTPEDDYEALKEFNHAYEGTTTAVEEMHLEYQRLLDEIPGLARRSSGSPARSSAARERPKKGLRGVFFCYALPALDKEQGEFTEEAGTTRWYLYDAERDAILEEPARSSTSIRSTPDTPRVCTTDEADAPRDARRGREAHQEHVPQARRCARRRRAAAALLDGAERRMTDDYRDRARGDPDVPVARPFLRDELDWPIDSTDDFEELTFDYTPEELGIDAANAAKIEEIKRLRPLVAQPAVGHLLRQVRAEAAPGRRAAAHPQPRRRQEAGDGSAAEQQKWATDDLLFISDLRRGRRAADQLRALLAGSGARRPADAEGARRGTTRTRRCTSTTSPSASSSTSRGRPRRRVGRRDLARALALGVRASPPRGRHDLEGARDPARRARASDSRPDQRACSRSRARTGPSRG